MEDHVELPRLYMLWHTPALLAPGDAGFDLLGHILSEGDHSRLYRRLVYELEIAQDVSAFQYSQMLGSTFWIVATARPGVGLDVLEQAIQEELEQLFAEGPSVRENARARNQIDVSFLMRLEQLGGMYGIADMLNAYWCWTGDPDYFQEDRARYGAIAPDDLRMLARRYLRKDGRVVLSVVPEGHPELASPPGQEVHPR
jgi:zinc protease